MTALMISAPFFGGQIVELIEFGGQWVIFPRLAAGDGVAGFLGGEWAGDRKIELREQLDQLVFVGNECGKETATAKFTVRRHGFSGLSLMFSRTKKAPLARGSMDFLNS